MLGIHIGGETLDTKTGTQLELEQENPFLQFSDEVKGDFTLPFEVSASPKNLRLLDYAGILQKRIDSRGIDCTIMDNGLQHSRGKIKIEKPDINRRDTGAGSISCFYLSGVANFFQDIKDIKLAQVDLGGDRSWTNATNHVFTQGLNPDVAGTWWHHIHQVLDAPVNAFDYAFYPVIDQAWTGAGEINRMVWGSDDKVRFDQYGGGMDANVIIPFPYLHYVLKQAVKHVGWKVEGSVFDDPDFMRVTMVNFYGVDWAYGWATPLDPNDPMSPQSMMVKPTVTINLQNHMPDYSISEFLIALKNRFGWWYDFDRKNKVIRIQKLANILSSRVVDYSKQASVVITKKLQESSTVYALKNEFVGEGSGGALDLTAVTYMGEVQNVAALPAPTASNNGWVYLSRMENNFYQCRNKTTNTFGWELAAYNIYDITPDGAKEEISTKATTIGMEWSDFYGQMVPRYDLNGVWIDRNSGDSVWGIHLLMYHGHQLNADGRPYPFATSGIYNYQGIQLSQWALPFDCKTKDGVPVGLYETSWKKVLESVANLETLEFSIYLSITEFLQMQFSDTVVIDGVKMYLTKIKSTIPFNGFVIVEAIRV